VALSIEDVTSALSSVMDPELRAPITTLDMVGDISVSDSSLAVEIRLTIVGCPAADTIERDVRQALSGVAGERSVELTVGVMTTDQRTSLITRLRKGKSPTNPFTPDSLTRVIAVTSGKGGVGKSSITVNLAAAVSRQGFSVGIIDADVLVSIPGLLGIPALQPTRIDDMMLPPVAHDIKVLSIGMFLGSDQAVAWRGPLLHRTLEQFLTDSYFGDLDFLFLDLPRNGHCHLGGPTSSPRRNSCGDYAPALGLRCCMAIRRCRPANRATRRRGYRKHVRCHPG